MYITYIVETAFENNADVRNLLVQNSVTQGEISE